MPLHLVSDGIVRGRLVSDGFRVDAVNMIDKKACHRMDDVFAQKRGISSSEAVRRHVRFNGFVTSPPGSQFHVVILPGPIFSKTGYDCGRLPGRIDWHEVKAFAMTSGCAAPPHEIAYHGSRSPEMLQVARRAGLCQLVIMGKPFRDHRGDLCRWAVNCIQGDHSEALTLTDGSPECVLFQTDGLVYLDNQAA